jgi:hypothetical protein
MRMTYFYENCWPVQRIAFHVCHAPWIVCKIFKPVVFSLMDMRTQSCTLVHYVPNSQILDDLSSYGILKNVMPTEMGGTIQLDQSEWIASRRAESDLIVVLLRTASNTSNILVSVVAMTQCLV